MFGYHMEASVVWMRNYQTCQIKNVSMQTKLIRESRGKIGNSCLIWNDASEISGDLLRKGIFLEQNSFCHGFMGR